MKPKVALVKGGNRAGGVSEADQHAAHRKAIERAGKRILAHRIINHRHALAVRQLAHLRHPFVHAQV